MDHLERAEVELDRAGDHTTETVQLQIQTLREGLVEEEGGDRTQEEPEAKIDRLVEVKQKLDALMEEIEDQRGTDHVQTARDHVDTYLRNHPTAENPGEQ